MKLFVEEMQEEETRAKAVSSFLSSLSVIDKIKKIEEDSKLHFAKAKYNLNSFISSLRESLSPKSMVAYSLIGAIGLSLVGCNNKKNDGGSDSTTSIITEDEEDVKDLIPETDLFKLTLNKSKSETQRAVFSSVGKFLADYNIRFGEYFAEDVEIIDEETERVSYRTVKPALTWNEVMAMAFVYNDFSKAELFEIINGSEINANDLKNSYRTAILQLIGAHVIESSEQPVRIDVLLRDKKAKEFYQKYHKMFLKCKETTGDEQLEAVNKFYAELYKDFPITDEVRQVGLMHSDTRKQVQPYKFSIIPMVAASEMLFQNLEIDHTMTQEVIDYMNDLGACNIADDILDKVGMAGLISESNVDYADYDKLRGALIEFLLSEDAYNVNDEERDLSQLTLFQETLLKFLGLPKYYTVTYTVTEYFTVTTEIRTKDRDEAVAAAGEDAVSAAEKAAQEALDRENQANKDKAEQEADKKAEQMQQEADKNKEDLQNKVDKDDKDFQDKIEDANNNGGTVNENDLGHGTDFDSNHSDSNGNLNGSVTDITTDSSGDKTDEPLPDPNAGYSFEKGGETPTESNTPSFEETDAPIYSYEEPFFESEEDIDTYIDSLANCISEVNISPKVYYRV